MRGYNEEMIKTETESIIDYINNNLNKLKKIENEVLDLGFNLSMPIYMDCFETSANNQYNIFKKQLEINFSGCFLIYLK